MSSDQQNLQHGGEQGQLTKSPPNVQDQLDLLVDLVKGLTSRISDIEKVSSQSGKTLYENKVIEQKEVQITPNIQNQNTQFSPFQNFQNLNAPNPYAITSQTLAAPSGIKKEDQVSYDLLQTNSIQQPNLSVLQVPQSSLSFNPITQLPTQNTFRNTTQPYIPLPHAPLPPYSGVTNPMFSQVQPLYLPPYQQPIEKNSPKIKKEKKENREIFSTDDDMSMDEAEEIRQNKNFLGQYTPQLPQYVQVNDIPEMQPNEDIYLYIQKFENSYGANIYDEKQRIVRLTNKLINVDPLYQYACSKLHFNSYPQFKSRLIKNFGKSKDQLLDEFNQLQQEPHERLSQFLERCLVKLSNPTLKRNQGMKYVDLFNKLPQFYKEVISRSDVKNISMLIREVKKIEGDYLHQEIWQMKQKAILQNNQIIHSQDFNRSTITNQAPVFGRGGGRDHKNFGRGGRFGPSFTPNPSQRSTQPQPPSIPQPQPSPPPEKPLQNSSNFVGITDFNFLTQKETFPTLVEREYNFRNRTKTSGSKVKVQKRISTKRTAEPMDKELDDEEGLQINDLPNEQVQQQFDNQQKIQTQIDLINQENEENIILNDNVIIDSLGNISLTKALKSIKCQISLFTLQKLKDQAQIGDLPIYFSEQIQQFVNQQVQIQKFNQSIKGTHLLLPVKLNTQTVDAIIDTGAVKSLISLETIKKCNLQENIQFYSDIPSVSGVSGLQTDVQSYVDTQLFLQDISLKISLPIINTSAFDLLIGQDILQNQLNQCIINLHNQTITFDTNGITKILKLHKSNISKNHILVNDFWPQIKNISGTYDLALIDLPLQYPKFYDSSIPYPTQCLDTLKHFKEVLEIQMGKDAILLFWCSGKNIQDILQLINYWGYKYVNILLAWVKTNSRGEPRMGLGHWTRNNLELLILVTKGKVDKFRNIYRNISQTITLYQKPEQLHSAKPLEVYQVLEQIFKIQEINCIEYFARLKNSEIQQKHFTLYGNEIPDYIQYSQKFQIISIINLISLSITFYKALLFSQIYVTLYRLNQENQKQNQTKLITHKINQTGNLQLNHKALVLTWEDVPNLQQTSWGHLPQNVEIPYDQGTLELPLTSDLSIQPLEELVFQDKIQYYKKKKQRRKQVKTLVSNIFKNTVDWRPTAPYDYEEPVGLHALQFLSIFKNQIDTFIFQFEQNPLINTLSIEKKLQFQKFYKNIDMDENYKLNEQIFQVFFRNFEVFNYDGKVGKVKNITMEFYLKPGIQPQTSKFPKLDQEKTDFLDKTIQEWLQKDYIYEGFTPYQYNPVIVRKKGKKKYRICFNFQPFNEMQYDIQFESLETIQIQNHGYKAKFICSIDCSEAHQSIQVHPNHQKYLGLKTHKGTYISKVGQFGLLTMSKIFNKALNKSIGHLQKFGVLAYADDIIIFAETLQECIKLLDLTLQSLLQDGFVVASEKCKFFKAYINVLGLIVGNHKVQVDSKRIQAINQIPLPKSKKALQKFIGQFTYLRRFLPNISTFLQPLYTILKQQTEPLYLNKNEIQIINSLKDLLTSQNVLILPDPKKPFYLTISFSTLGYGSILAQKVQGVLRPIAYYSGQNRKTGQFQFVNKLIALKSAVDEWRTIISTQKTIILTENSTLVNALKLQTDNDTINKLQSKIYRINFEVQLKPDSFKQLKFSQVLAGYEDKTIETFDHLLTEYEKDLATIQVKKQDFTFQVRFDQYDFTAYFDGACSKKLKSRVLGAYGFSILDRQGQVFYEEGGQVHFQDKITNNISEYYALNQLILFLLKHVSIYDKIQVIGDSQLVFKQIKNEYKVNNNSLRLLLRTIRDNIKPFKQLKLLHLPRKYNFRADKIASSTMQNILQKEKDIQNQQQQNIQQIFYVNQPDSISEIFCQLCGSRDFQSEMYICDICGTGQHQNCLGERIENSDQFLCLTCQQTLDSQDTADLEVDITVDPQFLAFLQGESITCSQKQAAKYQSLSKWYFFQEGSVYFKSLKGIKKVPTLSERKELAQQLHENFGHFGSYNTLYNLKKTYFWPNMHNDVKTLIQNCLICQAKNKKYLPMSNIYPTHKGLDIFQHISCDLIEIRGDQESQVHYVLTIIDNFSKDVELCPLSNKSSQTVSQNFRDQWIFRRGCPLVVRTDDGGEFKGEFQELMFRCGILHIRTGPRYPQGNGMVERLNRTIKQRLQSLYNSHEYNDTWKNLLQTIAFSIRVSFNRSTGFSPFQVIHGRDPLIPGHFTQLPKDTFHNITKYFYSSILTKLISLMQSNKAKIHYALQKQNNQIFNTIRTREFKHVSNLKFGDPILVKLYNDTKLYLETEKCYFIEYITSRKDSIIFYNPCSKRFLRANISNVKVVNQR